VSLPKLICSAAFCAGFFLASAQTAHAVKGAKKAGPERLHQGVVSAVDPKGGSLTVRTGHLHKKKRNKNQVAGNGVAVNHLKFHVHKGTQFATSQNGQTQPSNFSAVTRGSFVSVASHNNQADAVLIHRPNKHRRKYSNPTQLVKGTTTHPATNHLVAKNGGTTAHNGMTHQNGTTNHAKPPAPPHPPAPHPAPAPKPPPPPAKKK